MVDREKKKRKLEMQRFENEKSYFDGIKNIFHNYLRAIIW